MKRLLRAIFAFAVFLFLFNEGYSQNSNIGTEFWTGYMDHVDQINGVIESSMSLYIASDVASTVTISIADGSFTTQTVNVLPNKITEFIVPSSAFLGDNQGTTSKGIHIVSNNPIAVYAHIYRDAVSGATLLLPINTLANDYYSLNYTQVSNSLNPPEKKPSYSTFMVIATEDNTTVEITPSATLIDGTPPNVPFQVTLQKGQIYQGLSNTDLTKTHITSVATSSGGCKRIAVFSGSSKISIGSPNNSADNLFQQVYPTASWGKNYITVPLKNRNYDVIRVVVSDLTAVVTSNGVKLNQLINNFYYEFNSQSVNVISSDKPIQVVQYAVSQGNTISGKNLSGDVGDPEMIFLNPLEQNIDHVTLYSTAKAAISASYINVVIPTTAVNSFLYDGASIGGFSIVPGNAIYSYAQLSVQTGVTHTISANVGFNAIAYGFGQFESYGYAAGTNVKNLNEYVQLVNPSTDSVDATGCTGVGFIPQIVLPYVTSKLTWDFGNGIKDSIMAPPYTTITKTDGTPLYKFPYSKPITYTTPNTYSIKVTAVDPITTLCGSNEEIDLNFSIYDPPMAKFTSRDSICLIDTIGFKDITDGSVNAIKLWHWNFGNGDTSAVQNPVYTYLKSGLYTVTLTVTGKTGCTTSASKIINVRTQPVSGFKVAPPTCESPLSVSFTDTSKIALGKITQWFWNFGDNGTSTLQNPTHPFASAGSYPVNLTVFSDRGCAATASKSLAVNYLPKVDFVIPDVCQFDKFAHFTANTSVTDSVSDNLTYAWDFGDAVNAPGANTATGKTVQHHYKDVGNYNVKLTVTTAYKCVKDTVKQLFVNGSSPKAAFTVHDTALCSNKDAIFTTNANVPGFNNGKITSFVIDFGDGSQPKTFRLDPGQMFSYKYPIQYTASKTYKVLMTAFSGDIGGICKDTISHYIKLLPVPNTTFNLPAKICQNADSIALASLVTQQIGGPPAVPTFLIDGIASSTGIFNPHVAGAGKHTITCYNIVTATQCADTIIKSITVEPTAKISAGAGQIILLGAQIKLKATSTGGNNVTFSWSPSTGLNDATAKNPTASPLITTTYTLTATSTTESVGCSVTDTITVTVLQPPVIPNTFTPNGDGINDTWKIKNLETYPGCTVDVYDRNGAIVFSSIGYGIPWDGRFNYINLPVGTYYYIINPKNGRGKIAGSVTIIR